MESKFQTQGTAICKDCSTRHYVLFKELEESWEDCRAGNKGKAHKRGGWRGQHRPREEAFSLPESHCRIFNKVSGMIRLSCEKSTLGIEPTGESSLRLPLPPGGKVAQRGLAVGTMLACGVTRRRRSSLAIHGEE